MGEGRGLAILLFIILGNMGRRKVRSIMWKYSIPRTQKTSPPQKNSKGAHTSWFGGAISGCGQIYLGEVKGKIKSKDYCKFFGRRTFKGNQGEMSTIYIIHSGQCSTTFNGGDFSFLEEPKGESSGMAPSKSRSKPHGTDLGLDGSEYEEGYIQKRQRSQGFGSWVMGKKSEKHNFGVYSKNS